MRHEFSKAIKRAALARSKGLCEAIGEVYGLPPGVRCNASLAYGWEADHYPTPATDRGSDTLENCVAACKACHRFKTSKYDVPMQAKGKRLRDKHAGIRKPSTLRGKGFPPRERQHTATRAIRWRGQETAE